MNASKASRGPRAAKRAVPPHRCRWPHYATRGVPVFGKESIDYRAFLAGWVIKKCPVCGAEREVHPTIAQAKRMAAGNRPSYGIHDLSHDFQRRFYGKGSDGKPKWTGWEFMRRAARWAERNPTVIVTRVDDDYFACSDLILIPHETRRYHMGTTVVYVPQCTGEPPVRFFLYPGHLNGLIDALLALRARAHRKKGWRR